MRLLSFLIFFACAGQAAFAQTFIQKEQGQKLTLKQVQRQFHDWAQERDLSKTKHWKYFKRWEQELQLHTTPDGEPVEPAVYLNAAIAAANEKAASASSRFSQTAWYPVGPNIVPTNNTGYMENGIGRINCIAFHPTSPSTYFVGVAQGGVWKTTNNGQTWAPLTDNLPITRVSDISIDPNNPNTMYISLCDFEYIGAGLYLDGRKRHTHYGLGVYKTTDGGATWQPTGLSFELNQGDATLIRKILVNPANSSSLVACGASGMYLSSNGGTTWNRTLDSLFWDLVQHPTNPNILYAATGWVRTANVGHSAIYKSTDFGASWTLLPTNIPGTGLVQRIKLAIAPSNPDYVYAAAVNTTNGLYGIYKTTNAGTSWTFITPNRNVLDAYQGNTSNGQGNYDLAMMVNSQNPNIVYTGGVNIWASTDGAENFSPVSHWTTQYGPTLHGDIHFMEQQPVTGQIFVCNDGGLYRTSTMLPLDWALATGGTPWPTQWTNISNDMAITSFYRLSSSKNATGRLVAGSQDNATFYFDGSTWSTIFGGDGMDNYLDPQDDYSVIGSSQYGYFYHSSDGGLSYNSILSASGQPAEWTTPLVADYNQPGRLYVGFGNVRKSTNGGSTWTTISNFPASFPNNEISALAVANSNSNVLYAAKRIRYEHGIPGTVYRTANGGSTWTNITAGLPDSLYFTSIEAGETDASVAYISMAGFSAGQKVYKTTNGGATWQNISYNLPNIPVNCVKYVPGKNALLLATDIGVYVLPDGATAWVNQSQGLPNVIVSDIEFNPALNKIYIGTFGRGIWATDLSAFISGTGADLADLGIELYPSPNNGTFSIRFSDSKAAPENFQLEVIDVTGKVVHRAALSGKATQQVKLNVPSGMYFARLTGKHTSGSKRFVVN